MFMGDITVFLMWFYFWFWFWCSNQWWRDQDFFWFVLMCHDWQKRETLTLWHCGVYLAVKTHSHFYSILVLFTSYAFPLFHFHFPLGFFTMSWSATVRPLLLSLIEPVLPWQHPNSLKKCSIGFGCNEL